MQKLSLTINYTHRKQRRLVNVKDVEGSETYRAAINLVGKHAHLQGIKQVNNDIKVIRNLVINLQR